MTTPIANRLAAPAPDASSSGIRPATMAAVVIRIGRSRWAAACEHRLPPVETLLLLLLARDFADQDAVLGDEADQRDQTDLAVDVEGHEAGGQRQQRAD